MDELERIDPEDCGCTDCITGYSKPINRCSQQELQLLFAGALDNASGSELELLVRVKK